MQSRRQRNWYITQSVVFLFFITMMCISSSCSLNAIQTSPSQHSSSPSTPIHSPTVTTFASATTDQAGPNSTNGAGSPAKISDVVKVTILSSRGTVSHDGSYGVYADIQNISPYPLTLKASETVLVVQPEVSHPIPCVDWATAIFPTQSPSISTNPQTANAEIRILSNEHYTVFWDLSPRPPQKNGMCGLNSKARDYFGFVPGEYAFTVEGIAHVQGQDTGAVAHTFTETTNLKVGISLAFTATAAFFGGLLAYLVVFLQPGQDFDKWHPESSKTSKIKVIAIWCRNALAAGLLAASVTIIASRLSDTQFPVKVSVSDFWGALTIGFVSYFIGTKFIAALASKLTTSSMTPTAQRLQGALPQPPNPPPSVT